MNKKIMIELADYIEALPRYRFSMSNWYSQIHYRFTDSGEPKVTYSSIWGNADYNGEYVISYGDCNTAGCLAGWAVAFDNDGVFETSSTGEDTKELAMELLELTHMEAEQLFYWSEDSIWYIFSDELGIKLSEGSRSTGEKFWYVDEKEITPKIAASALRFLAQGIITFDPTFEDEPVR